MKTKLLLIGILIWSINSVSGQICGTPHPANPIIYPQEKNDVYKKGSSSAICINVYFHIVRNTNGTYAFPIPNIDNIVRELNKFYSPHKTIINNLGSDFIDNSNFVTIDNKSEANSLSQNHNRNDAINYYIVEELWDKYDENGNYIGYVAGTSINTPSNNLVIRSDNVLNPTSPHELGHCLYLLHTHETSKGIEAINGSNCSIAGDLICDTPADPELGISNVNVACDYTGGGGYNPLTNNIMSYSHDFCKDSFTDGQGFRMRYAINFESILQNIKSNLCAEISEITTICYPQTTTVTLSNIGTATTAWSSSSNVQIVSSNNSSASIRGLNSYSNGDGWIKATLSNGITFQENFHVGKAEISNVVFRNAVGGIDYFCSSHIDNEFEILPYVPDTSYEIRIRDLNTFSIVSGPYNFTGRIGTLPTDYNYTPGWYLFEVRSTNSCGITNWTEWEVEFVDCSLGEGGGEMEYIIYPNPSSETLTIQKKAETSKRLDNASSIKLYDFNSNLIYKNKINNQKVINVSNYKKGRYILKINKNKKSETHHIIIE